MIAVAMPERPDDNRGSSNDEGDNRNNVQSMLITKGSGYSDESSRGSQPLYRRSYGFIHRNE